MKMFLRDSPLRYLATPIALGIAVLLSYIFRPVIPYSTEYIFLSAVFLAGWMGGRGPGLITAAVAPFVYDYFFLPPLYTLDIDREAWPLILPFFLCALGAAWVSSIRSEASRAKSTIQVNQDRFSRILANLRDIAWTVDGSGKFLYVSPKIDELTGRTDKEVYAGGIKAFVERVHPKDLIRVERANEDLLIRGQAYDIEFRYQKKNGEWIWLNSRSLGTHRSGDSVLADGMLIDITLRKRAEEEKKELLEAVQQERDTLSAVINAMNDEVWLFDLDGSVILMNSEVSNHLGLKPETKTHLKELTEGLEIRRPDGSLIPPEEAVSIRAARGETIRNEKQTLRVLATGEVRHREVNATPLRDSAGNIVGVVSVVHDITAREQASARITQLNRLYATLSSINQVILHNNDFQDLVTSACRIAVDEGKFRMAWIGMIDSSTYELRHVASSGIVDGYLDLVTINLSNLDPAAGPVARCVLSGEHAIFNDIERDLLRPWKKVALDKGFRSVAAFPIRCESELVGVFCLYSAEIGFFDEIETRLLDELAGDISYALAVDRHKESRKKTEVELKSKTALLEAQVNSTIDGILVVDPGGRMILQNRRFLELFKIPPEIQSIGEERPARENASDLLKDPEAFMARIDYLNAHPMEPGRDEIEFKDGSTFDRYSAPVVDDDGKYYGRIWTFRDITDRKKAEVELKSKTALLEAQLDSTIDGIMVLDLFGRMILHNRRFLEIWKFPPELLLGDDGGPAREYVSGLMKDSKAFDAKIDYLIAHPLEISRDEIEFKDGSTFERYSAPVADDAGKYFGRIWTFRDITERKRNEDKLRQLSLAVEQSPAVVVITDLIGNITYVNHKFTECTGYTADEVQGKNPRILNSGYSSPETYKLLWQTITRGHEWRGEFRNRKKNGETYWEAATITPILNKAGEVTHFLALKEDITERRAMEVQLRQSQKMEAIGQLTGGIAHDFNNLLGVIIGNLDLLERQIKDNEPAVKRVHTARNASLRGADLTRRLLAFSRQETLQPKAIDLNAAIRAVLALAAPALGPEIEVITKLHSSIPTVFADPSGLENALLNLVVNARDAMANGGKLTITSELRTFKPGELSGRERELTPGEYAHVAVSDTGHGMTKEIAEKVFEPFFTTKSHGTGLGLSMVYGFFKQSSGTVRAYSEPGYGTTMSFLLPLVGGGVKAPSAPIPETPGADAAGSAILIVDDEAELLDIAATNLSGLGYTVLTASDGASAKQLIQDRNDIALLLTDIIMPGGMTGVDLAEWTKKAKPSIRVIYCSGFPAEALAARNMSLAEDSLLRKPYQRAQLISIVRKALASLPAQ